ncbi:MAG: plasmid recombination protein [Oscillospiraceae bacterium]|nr:plasmid recombination protein [Oscillospiraceae bacterium]
MARNTGDRTCVRNVNVSDAKIGNTQAHNEREKKSYVNPDIVPERTELNVHFKAPTDDYTKMFSKMEEEKTISTRGLKPDATKFCELVFDVNSAYFYNHGGYDYARQFYEEAYRAAVEIVGGEQYILSAVMHADERNRAMSEQLGEDVYHYHLHVVYVPVVEKKVLYSKRCKDPALRGTVKEVITQVSRSKKWASKPAVDDIGEPIRQKNGKPAVKKSYSVLQDDFYRHMVAAGYTDIERGEVGSTEEHLTVTQFKVEQEQQRLAQIQDAAAYAMAEKQRRNEEMEAARKKARQAQAQLDAVVPKVKAIEELARRYSDDVDKVLPEAGALETARSYREKKAKPLYKKIVGVLRALYNKYLDLINSFNRLRADYDRLQQHYASLDASNDRLAEENTGLKQVAANYDTLCRGYGADRVAEQVRAIRDREKEQKRLRRIQRQRHNIEAR